MFFISVTAREEKNEQRKRERERKKGETQ